MGLMLGVDTGGTYTDAVLVDPAHSIVARAKALTTHDDLARGLSAAVRAVLPKAEGTIERVSISTTLATNAVVEGQGARVATLLVGQSTNMLDRGGLRAALHGDPVVFIGGGHDAAGVEREALDLDAAREAIAVNAGQVSAFAVSSFFATRNPAHERRLQQLITEMTGLPVSLGHDLSSALDAPRRALTAVLNARLIPLLAELIRSVRGLLMRCDIAAPLMVVRGDGSLMSAEFALRSPVETILSGPAASLIGARALTGESDAAVLDIGGTTSDIGALAGGEPVQNPEGAVIGGWRTRVRAVAVHTYGIGGDSAVRSSAEAALALGPDRVIPVSLLAAEYPQMLEVLRQQAAEQPMREHAGWFALRRRPPAGGPGALSPTQRLLWERLANGPIDLVSLFAGQTRMRALRRLVEQGIVALAGLTPTDAAHGLGEQDDWSVEAAMCGLTIGCRRLHEVYGGEAQGTSALAQVIRDRLEQEVARSVLSALLADTPVAPGGNLAAPARWFVDRAIGAAAAHAWVDVGVQLSRPLVVVGASAATYGRAIAGRLDCRGMWPADADVANALGAVSTGVVQRVVLTILPVDGERYRVHGGDRVATFATLAAAGDWAHHEAERLAHAQASAAGGVDIGVTVERDDSVGHAPTGEEVFFQARITAIGRGYPKLAH